MSNSFSTFLKKMVLHKDQNLVSMDEPYEAINRLLKDRRVKGIIDAGASDGHISGRMLRHFPGAHVYAFEPNTIYREALLQYSAREPRFHPHFLALGDRNDTVDLHVTESPGNTSLCVPLEILGEIDPAGAKVKSVDHVELVTIDSWMDREGVDSIEFMKFDIQGAELRAMNGARRALTEQTLAIYTEVWFNHAYREGAVFAQIDLFLRDMGYIVYDIYKPRYHDNGMLMWGNVLYLHAGRMGL